MAKAGDGAVRETMAVEKEGSASPGEWPVADESPVLRHVAANPGFVQTLREVMRVRLAKFASCILFITVVAAIFAPWLAPHDPVKSRPWDSLKPPSSQYWLGADRLGRDQLSRLIY